jgi:hypothetical protein
MTVLNEDETPDNPDSPTILSVFETFMDLTDERGSRQQASQESCKSSLINGRRARRSKASIGQIEQGLYDILAEDHPQTVRQVYYQAVCRGIIDKTENEYKNTVCRILAAMRRRGAIPFDWLADNTRWMRKPTTYTSLRSALLTTQRWYRRDLWAEADAYVEVWLEKEALAGVLCGVTEEWDVPLMVTRGYPSMSFLYSAAEQIREQEKPTFLYYFGDFDPSGVDISRNVEASIREYAPAADIIFERVAVNENQIDEMDLPTRPTKRENNSHAKKFASDRSVEVDAIPAAELRRMCQRRIMRHIDDDRLEALRVVEAQERETLAEIAETYGGRR